MSSMLTSALHLPAWLIILGDTLLERVTKKERKQKWKGWVYCLEPNPSLHHSRVYVWAGGFSLLFLLALFLFSIWLFFSILPVYYLAALDSSFLINLLLFIDKNKIKLALGKISCCIQILSKKKKKKVAISKRSLG